MANVTTKLAFPSAEFPAQPDVSLALTMQIPTGWKALPTKGTVLATRRVAEDAGFTPNVIVIIQSRPDSFVVTDALAEIKDAATTKPQGVTSEPYKVEIDGRQFEACDLSWVDDKMGAVMQTHLFSTVPSGSSVKLIQVVGAVGGAQIKTEYPTIMAIMKTLTVA